ncbi:MAG: hypothetical protein LBL96_09595 [Clostridiales bacterium]|nr:hypothetical protein [Clostridiales bacterium]
MKIKTIAFVALAAFLMFANTGCAGRAENNQGNRTGQRISERVNRSSNGGWFWDTNDDSAIDDNTNDGYNRSYNGNNFGGNGSTFGNGFRSTHITPTPGTKYGNGSGRSYGTTRPYTSSSPDYRSGSAAVSPGSIYSGGTIAPRW